MKIINHFLDTADPRMDEITSLNDKYGQDGSGMEYLYGLLVSILVEQFEYANMKVSKLTKIYILFELHLYLYLIL